MVIELMIIILILFFLSNQNNKIFDISSLKYKWLLFFLLLIQVLTIFVFKIVNNSVEIKYIYHLNTLYYFIFIIFVDLNIKNKGFKLISTGGFLNFIAILLNGGRMPVSEEALNIVGDEILLNILSTDSSLTHVLASSDTNFKFLGDIIPIPKPYPFSKVISFGDIFIFIGIVIYFISRYRIYKNIRG